MLTPESLNHRESRIIADTREKTEAEPMWNWPAANTPMIRAGSAVTGRPSGRYA